MVELVEQDFARDYIRLEVYTELQISNINQITFYCLLIELDIHLMVYYDVGYSNIGFVYNVGLIGGKSLLSPQRLLWERNRSQ